MCFFFLFYFWVSSYRNIFVLNCDFVELVNSNMYLLSLFFSGVYGDAVTLEYLKDFHRRRVQILAESGADLIAFETIPNKLEAKVFA